MAQKYCYQIGEWVQDNVSQHVEQCVEQDCDWWCACCNKWLCALVWVVVTVLKWVVQTVCEIIGDAFDLVVDIIKGGWGHHCRHFYRGLEPCVGWFSGNRWGGRRLGW